ncbi:hypothetical protein [Alishewanella longhuensis]
MIKDNLLDNSTITNEQTSWPIRWELLMRYRLIEIVALWGR